MRVMSAIVFACLAAGSAGPASAAPYTPIDVITPSDDGGGRWDGDRMRGARERLKDIIPGRL